MTEYSLLSSADLLSVGKSSGVCVHLLGLKKKLPKNAVNDDGNGLLKSQFY